MILCNAGNIAPSKDLPAGEWKAAHPGYDFLALIEQDKKKKKTEHDRLNILPKTQELGDVDSEPVSMADNTDTDAKGESVCRATYGMLSLFDCLMSSCHGEDSIIIIIQPLLYSTVLVIQYVALSYCSCGSNIDI